MNRQEKDAMWDEYRTNPTRELKEQILATYQTMFDIEVSKMYTKLGRKVDIEEIRSDGYLGLLDAMAKYEIKKGYRFETYAPIRIRGAILDSVRKRDWVPKNIRQMQREYQRVVQEIQQTGEKIDDIHKEVKHRLGWEENELHQVLKAQRRQVVFSIEGMRENDEELVSVSEYGNPEEELEGKEEVKILKKHIQGLPEKERLFVEQHYLEGKTQTWIAKEYGFSVPGVNKIVKKGVARLKKEMQKY